MKTIQDYQHEISLKTQELNYAKEPEQKAALQIKLQLLKYQLEIATIKHKIELLSK